MAAAELQALAERRLSGEAASCSGRETAWAQQRPRGRQARGARLACQAKRRAGGGFINSDGKEHLGSTQTHVRGREFPGPPGRQGPPIRVLPIGGLGEIGMNCMLIGVGDRYILLDAGLMFPDSEDLGMQKVLPDISFLAQWRDKIEAVIITHGHEDHIGAMPWVVPALDPATPIYAPPFPMQLIKRRLLEYSLWDEKRFHTFQMRERFQLGPFECEPVRVTHSIPDCCGMVLRSEHGNVVHTGDWKIDETPLSGDTFDRQFFEDMSKEGVALLMSDSTNVLAPGRTTSEADVQDSLVRRVLDWNGKGRVITTQFASNVDRLASVKAAADASGRKVCFIGLSLTQYLEAAQREGRAPLNPGTLIDPKDLSSYDPNQVLIVTTGSQAEPLAQLSKAARGASHLLHLRESDLLLYSAKVIPGNEPRVMAMMNDISALGANIVMGRDAGLHTSGHAYRDELEEMLRLTRPQHFLPVHGEFAFLCAHAQLARENGILQTSVIRNGQMLGVGERSSRAAVGPPSSLAKAAVLGQARLQLFYNDGNNGTGTAVEMALEERTRLATQGIIIAAVDVLRLPPPQEGDPGAMPEARGEPSEDAAEGSDGDAEAGSQYASYEPYITGSSAEEDPTEPGEEIVVDGRVLLQRLQGRVRLKTRALWLDQGRLIERLHLAARQALEGLPGDAPLGEVERALGHALQRAARAFNERTPEVVVVATEANPPLGEAILKLAATRKPGRQQRGRVSVEGLGGRAGRSRGSARRETGSRKPLGERTARRRDGGRGGAADQGGNGAKPWKGGERRLAQRRAGNPRERPEEAKSPEDLVYG